MSVYRRVSHQWTISGRSILTVSTSSHGCEQHMLDCWKQQARGRYIADPGTLEQRLFRAITKPVIPPIEVTPTERRIRRQEEQKVRMANNPYRKFLIEKARSDFFRFADTRMLLVIQPLHHKLREFIPVRNELHTKGLTFRGFPVSILREASTYTRWQSFAASLLSTDNPNMYLFGNPSPQICAEALRILQKKTFLVLLGGVIEHRMMSVTQLQQFANSDLSVARAKLLGCLLQPGQSTIFTLTRPLTDLSWSLNQLSGSSNTIRE